MADVLVQTLIPPRLAKWVRTRADREGLAIAAWLRRLIMLQEAQSTSVRAWVRPRSEQVRNPSEIWGANQHPHILLDRVVGYADGTAEFTVSDPIDGHAFNRDDLIHKNVLADNLSNGGWLALDGSGHAWRVISSMLDAAHGGQLRVTLRPEPPHDARGPFDVTPSWWPDSKIAKTRREQAFHTLESELRQGAGVTTGHDVSPMNSERLSFTLHAGHGGLTDDAARALQKKIAAVLEAV